MALFREVLPGHNYPIEIFNVFPRLEDQPFTPADPPELTQMSRLMESELSIIRDVVNINQSFDMDIATTFGASAEEQANAARNILDWFRPYIGTPVFHGYRIVNPQGDSDPIITPDSKVGILTGVEINKDTVMRSAHAVRRIEDFLYTLHVDLTVTEIADDTTELPAPTFNAHTFTPDTRPSSGSFGNYLLYGTHLYTNPGYKGQQGLPTDAIILPAATTFILEKRIGNFAVENVNYSRTEGIVRITAGGDVGDVEQRRLTVRGTLRNVNFPIGTYVRSIDWQGYRWEVADVDMLGQATASLSLYRDTENTDPVSADAVQLVLGN